jgi:hypothetical protein
VCVCGTKCRWRIEPVEMGVVRHHQICQGIRVSVDEEIG